MVCKGNEEWERCYVNVCVFRMCRTCIDYVNIDRELGLISNMKVSNGRNGSHVTFMKRKRERESVCVCVCGSWRISARAREREREKEK